MQRLIFMLWVAYYAAMGSLVLGLIAVGLKANGMF